MNMIVKVQKPSVEPNGMWLIYDETGKTHMLMHKGALPQLVRDAVHKGGGYEYFTAEVDHAKKKVSFGAKASGHKW
jgi:hypothetical protein